MSAGLKEPATEKCHQTGPDNGSSQDEHCHNHHNSGAPKAGKPFLVRQNGPPPTVVMRPRNDQGQDDQKGSDVSAQLSRPKGIEGAAENYGQGDIFIAHVSA
jgi:hypothetical protein